MGRKLLEQWLRAAGLTHEEMAKRLDYDRSSVTSLVLGRRNAGRGLAIAIERVTAGAVPVESWEPKTRRRRAA